MTYEDGVKALRDLYDEPSRVHMSWNQYKKGHQIQFHKVCGDGCCSWSDDYFLEPGDSQWPQFEQFFAQYPNGEEWYNETEEDS